MENIFVISGQVAVLFLLIAVGAVLRWTKLLKEESVEGMVNLLILVVTPCLIVDVFQRPFSPAMLSGLGISFLVAVLGHAAVIVLAYLLVRHRDENVRRPMMLAAVFSNAGFMGLPLEQAILGDVGVFYGIVYVVVFNLVMWSWGYGTMVGNTVPAAPSLRGAGKRDGSPHSASCGARFARDIRYHASQRGRCGYGMKAVVNPGTVGIALGLPLFFCSAKLPAIVGTPVHLIAGLNTPLAMIVIGYCLVGAKLARVAKMPVVYVATGIRLVGYPLLVIAALFPFRQWLDRDMMVALTVSASAPVAAMVSMFATKFGRDVDTSVAVVSGSTLLSILTMPAVIALAMSVL